MSRKALLDMRRATDILHERSLTTYKDARGVRMAIEAQLDELDARRDQARKHQGEVHIGRALGADTLFQGWLTRQRAELQQALAMARAREIDAFGRAKTDFARLDATKTLLRKEDAARKTRSDARSADALDHLAMMRAFQTGR